MSREAITTGLKLIFQGIDKLRNAFDGHRKFTIDGRLVGDIGEVIAALEYDLELDKVSQPIHDATTPDGRNVQIKATFKESLTFSFVPDYYLGFRLFPDGSYEEIFNGPGKDIYDHWASRKGIGVALLSFPIAELRKLSERVPANKRIQKRGKQIVACDEGELPQQE